MAKLKTKKERHPLYNSWAWMRRMHTKFNVCEDWYNDFYLFVDQMGERPSEQHRLNRIDSSKGFSVDNCEWKKIIKSESKAEYQREWRKANPEKAKNNELTRAYGLTLEEYNTISLSQNHVCKICGEAEPYNNSLAVDHCHTTGEVRGLLCSNCNRALGFFKDSKEILNNAIVYLSKK